MLFTLRTPARERETAVRGALECLFVLGCVGGALLCLVYNLSNTIFFRSSSICGLVTAADSITAVLTITKSGLLHYSLTLGAE